MIGYVVQRFLAAVPVLLLVAIFSFLLLQLIPGDPALVMLGEDASPEQIQALRESLKLDRPLWEQLTAWLGGLLTGDLGTSIVFQRPVLDLVLERLPLTVWLGLLSLGISIPFGVGLGVLAAIYRGTVVDSAVGILALIGLSLPNFWIGLMGIYFFSVMLGWVPPIGNVSDRGFGTWVGSMILPATVIGTAQMGLLARITRSTMLDVLKLDYVRTARAKGVSEFRVVLKHALRNALIPIVTVIGVMFSLLIAGAVIVETVFAIPGVGRLVVQSIVARDYPVVQGALLLIAGAFVIINLLVDLAYVYLDPRVNYE